MARVRVSSDALGKAVTDGVFDDSLCEGGVMMLHDAPGSWFGLVEALEAACTRARLAGRMTDGQGVVLARYLLAFASAVGVGKDAGVLEHERLRRSLEPLHAPVLANLRTRRVEFRGALAELTPLMMAEDERLADVVVGELVAGGAPAVDEAFLLRVVARYAALQPDAAMRAIGRFAARAEARGGALSLLHSLVCLGEGEGGGGGAAALGSRAFNLGLEVLMSSTERPHVTTALRLVVALLPTNARKLGARLSDIFHVLSRLPALIEPVDAPPGAGAASPYDVTGGVAGGGGGLLLPLSSAAAGASLGGEATDAAAAPPPGSGGAAPGGTPLRESYGLLLQYVYAIAPAMFVDTMRAACDASPRLSAALAPHLDALRLLPGVLRRHDMAAAAAEWERVTPDEVVERVLSALVAPDPDARAAAATLGAPDDRGWAATAPDGSHARLLELHRSMWRAPVPPPVSGPPSPTLSGASPAPLGGARGVSPALAASASARALAAAAHGAPAAAASRAAAYVPLLQQELVFQRHLRWQAAARCRAMRLQLAELATAAAERDAMRETLTKSQAAVAALNTNCEGLRRSMANGQRAQREWQLQIEGRMMKLIEERNRAAEDNLRLVQSTQAAAAESVTLRQQVELMSMERTRLVAEVDCLRRENLELSALRMHTQELAENVRLRDWQLATVINPALEHYTSLVARQDLFDAAVVDARASAGSPGGADMRDAVQRELAAENARLTAELDAVRKTMAAQQKACQDRLAAADAKLEAAKRANHGLERRLAEVLLREEMNAKRSGGRQGRPFFLATGAAAAAAAEADAAGAMGADGAAPLHAPEPTEHHV